jgi:hypothetical protein
MPRNITIHKSTHLIVGSDSKIIAKVQKRGDMCYLNLIDDAGNVTEKTWAVGTCCNHLTGHGAGVAADMALSVDSMQNAWRFTFGETDRLPLECIVASPAK